MLASSNQIESAFAKFRRERPESSVEATVPAAIEAAFQPTRVNARLNYSIVGVCPYCEKPMGRVNCCDQEVFLCEDDRFVSPLPNEEMPE
jgi:hypothetical protein